MFWETYRLKKSFFSKWTKNKTKDKCFQISVILGHFDDGSKGIKENVTGKIAMYTQLHFGKASVLDFYFFVFFFFVLFYFILAKYCKQIY